MLDKNKLIASLNAKKREKEGLALEAMNQFTINRTIANEIQEIIDEVEMQKEGNLFSIKDILSMMKQYCELWYKDGVPECKTCFFYNKEADCMMDRIRENVESKDKGK